MALDPVQEAAVISLLQRESRTRITTILRTTASFLDWLADVLDLAGEVWRSLRKAIGEFWTNLRTMFL